MSICAQARRIRRILDRHDVEAQLPDAGDGRGRPPRPPPRSPWRAPGSGPLGLVARPRRPPRPRRRAAPGLRSTPPRAGSRPRCRTARRSCPKPTGPSPARRPGRPRRPVPRSRVSTVPSDPARGVRRVLGLGRGRTDRSVDADAEHVSAPRRPRAARRPTGTRRPRRGDRARRPRRPRDRRSSVRPGAGVPCRGHSLVPSRRGGRPAVPRAAPGGTPRAIAGRSAGR